MTTSDRADWVNQFGNEMGQACRLIWRGERTEAEMGWLLEAIRRFNTGTPVQELPTPIEAIRLVDTEPRISTRLRRCLERLKIYTLQDLMSYSRGQLAGMKWIGDGYLGDIEMLLGEFGYRWDEFGRCVRKEGT